MHLQRRKLLAVDEGEGVREVDEVLEASVQVRLGPEQLKLVEVGVIDVCVDAEEPLEDGLDSLDEVRWEKLASQRKYLRGQAQTRRQRLAPLAGVQTRGSWHQEARLRIVQLALNPLHQVQNVVRGAALDGLLHFDPVCPSILVLRPGTHDRARLR